ncbi:3-methyladenine DNA glycosylase [Microbacterium caowuchunii]|uniref:3-methyladenine DNA glycosylase n=1 Tax=Microbacterium caowuchunii TaxID=2614638 RepID=A0A5N0TMT5_9MICO|nr:3-methyladenine DNA glycosylase [Microbacterium caowuchunii]KAA9135791.1 3-methyladenine DNA glycosylase [Microbacterium caowuchunii]
MSLATGTVLPRDVWSARESAHAARADALTAGRRERAATGRTHPVDDFLFTYYSYKPGLLRRWHPGAGTALADAATTPRAGWRWYTDAGAGAIRADVEAFRDEKAPLLRAIGAILRGSLDRPASYGCFGMHEWAMVYRDGSTRHAVPLRLGARGTDEVVESHDLRCTHFDAFRFFTPEAVPRNRESLDRASQAAREQPGCLHAGMDLYKWAVKLGPLVPGDLLLDAFELARDIRELDMRASPYDLTDWGYSAVPVETAAGKAEYVAAQRRFTERAQPIRRALSDLV